MTKVFTFILLFLSTTLLSQAYTIDKYDIQIDISEDGYYDIKETIDVNFNEKMRGIFRNIPKQYVINGKTQNIKLSKVKSKDYEYMILAGGNDNVIRLGSADIFLTGKHTYNFQYRISNAFIFADDHISFQYNLINDWLVPIPNFSYTITLPKEVSLGSDDVAMMTGATSETNQHLSLNIDGQQITGRTLTTIPAKDNATIALKLPLGYVAKPVSPFSLEAAKRKKGWVVPLALAFLTFGFFKSKTREEPIGVIEDEHFPPTNFSPPIVGAYYDNKVQTEDIISLLPYWANLGFVKILKGKDVLYFQKLKALPEDFPYYQSTLFNSIFENDELVMLEDLNTKLGSQVHKMKKQLHDQIVKRDLYDDFNYKIFHSGAFLVLGIALLVAAVVSVAAFNSFFLALALGLFAVVAFVIHSSRPKFSDKGIIIKKQLLGLKQFLKNGDPAVVSRIVKEQPDYFQKMYPYAIAFGIDKTWINRMEEMQLAAPDWYDHYDESGMGQGSAAVNSSKRPSMNDFSKDFDIPEISSVFTSVPQPEPGSRSSRSGGGFSGGGAGGGFGGGGGAW